MWTSGREASLLIFILASIVTVTVAQDPTTAPDSTAPPAPEGPASARSTGAPAFKCLVCSSDRKAWNKAGIPDKYKIYHKDCIKPTSELLKLDAENKFAVECQGGYADHMAAALAMFTPSGRNTALNTTNGVCVNTAFSVCRSYYYSYDKKYKQLNGGDEPEIYGKNERVFRFCGCITPKVGTPANTPVVDIRKEAMGGKSKICNDEVKGLIRKRNCYCDPSHADFSTTLCNGAPGLHTHLPFLSLMAAILTLTIKFSFTFLYK